MVFGGTLFIMVYRYVRVFDAIQRQQAKWFVYAAIVSLFLVAIVEETMQPTHVSLWLRKDAQRRKPDADV